MAKQQRPPQTAAQRELSEYIAAERGAEAVGAAAESVADQVANAAPAAPAQTRPPMWGDVVVRQVPRG